MTSIICVCCTSNCPTNKFLRFPDSAQGSNSASLTKLIQKQQHNTNVIENCLWLFISVSMFPCVALYNDSLTLIVICSSLRNTGQSWYLVFEGFKCMRHHHILLSNSCNLSFEIMSPHLSWVSECNPFCWSLHKMCTRWIYLYIFVSSPSLPSGSKVRIKYLLSEKLRTFLHLEITANKL